MESDEGPPLDNMEVRFTNCNNRSFHSEWKRNEKVKGEANEKVKGEACPLGKQSADFLAEIFTILQVAIKER